VTEFTNQTAGTTTTLSGLTCLLDMNVGRLAIFTTPPIRHDSRGL
jgi:hypothetical protein